MRVKRGFTLIELLVVIAIIAILAAILFPVFARARVQAESITSISNLNQIGMALQMYTQDYDDTYPTVPTPEASNVGDGCGVLYGGQQSIGNQQQLVYSQLNSFESQLYPYTKSSQVFICPGDNGAEPLANIGSSIPDTAFPMGNRFSSYGYRFFMYSPMAPNPCGYDANFSSGMGTVLKESSLPYPSQTFVYNELWVWFDNDMTYLPWLKADGWAPADRMNFEFADGHAKSYPVGQILLQAPYATGVGYDFNWPRLGTSDL